MKRSRANPATGSKKRRRSTKPKSLMAKVDKKISKALKKQSEFKIHTTTIGAKALYPIVTSAVNGDLPARNYWLLTPSSTGWPSQGAAGNQREGNQLKNCTTYFTINIRPWINNGVTTGSQITSMTIRVVIFAMAEFIDATQPLTKFFQLYTSTVNTMINPTNKGRVTVLYDKIHSTQIIPQYNATAYTHCFRKNIYIRFSRKFKDVIFDSAGDTTPKRPYRNTYIAFFNTDEHTTGQYGTMESVTRMYWVD